MKSCLGRFAVIDVIFELVVVAVACRPLQRDGIFLKEFSRGDSRVGESENRGFHPCDLDIRIDRDSRIRSEADVDREYLNSGHFGSKIARHK